MNVVSIVLGVLGIIFLIVMIIPIIGAVGSWIALILGFLGLIFGAISRKTSGRTLNIVVIIVAVLRLVFGGFFI